MKKCCANLKEPATEIIGCEKKEMLSLKKKDQNHKRNKNSVTYANKISMKIKITVSSGITAIVQRNTGALKIVSVV